MSLRAAVAAFAHRSVRRRDVVTSLVISGAVTLALLFVASEMARLHNLSIADEPFNAVSWSTWGVADLMALAVLLAVGFVVAPATVASAVTQERRAGTLDQLRTTPLSPVGVALGFVIGVPARMYLFCAGPLAVHVLATFAGVQPLTTLPGSLVLLALGTLLSCLVALASALSPRQESGGGMQVLALATLLGLTTMFAWGYGTSLPGAAWAAVHPAGALSALLTSVPSAWRSAVYGAHGFPLADEGRLALLPLAALVAGGVGGALLLAAAVRKLRAPERSLLSKPQALLGFVLLATALLVPGHRSGDAGPFLTALFSLVATVAMVVLGALSTPSPEAWARALRAGGRRGWLSDDAAPHRAMWLMQAGWLAVIAPQLTTLLRTSLEVYVAWGWLAFTAATVPLYVLFSTTRLATPAARAGFGVGIAAHLVLQMIGAAYLADLRDESHEGLMLFLGLCLFLAVMVPLVVWYRQRALARRILA